MIAFDVIKLHAEDRLILLFLVIIRPSIIALVHSGLLKLQTIIRMSVELFI